MSEELIHQSKTWEVIAREFNEIFDKLDPENPDESDLQALREYLAETPQAHVMVFDFARTVKDTMINSVYSDPILQICVKANADHILDEMGYEEAPMLERLLMDNLINWWLRLQLLELATSDMYKSKEYKRSEIEYMEDRLGVTQRYFMQACVTLVRIKKITLQTPRLHVNLGTDKDQEVNVTKNV